MPTKRAILSALTSGELRDGLDRYELSVDDRRIRALLVDALAGSRRVRIDALARGADPHAVSA